MNKWLRYNNNLINCNQITLIEEAVRPVNNHQDFITNISVWVVTSYMEPIVLKASISEFEDFLKNSTQLIFQMEIY